MSSRTVLEPKSTHQGTITLVYGGVPFQRVRRVYEQAEALRAADDEAWLSEVSVIEHDADGRYSVKAKNPSADKSFTGSGAAIGGLTGVFVGLIGGPLGLLFWGGLGALTGGAIGASAESAFKPMIDDLEGRLPPDPQCSCSWARRRRSTGSCPRWARATIDCFGPR